MCRDFGFWILDFGLGIRSCRDFGFWILDFGLGVGTCRDFGFGVAVTPYAVPPYGGWENRRVNVLFPQSKIQNPYPWLNRRDRIRRVNVLFPQSKIQNPKSKIQNP
jgi:hypothetical protein